MPQVNNKFKFKISQSMLCLSTDTIPKIDVPFPPKLDPRECITLKKDGNIPLKSPNCFILYRLAFYNELRASGFNAKQKVISEMVSQSWQKEPLNVKKTYKELARKVHYELIKMRRHFLGLTDDISPPIETSDSSKDIPSHTIQPTCSNTSQNSEANQYQNISTNTNDDSPQFKPLEYERVDCDTSFPIYCDPSFSADPNSSMFIDPNLQIFNTPFCFADENHYEFFEFSPFSYNFENHSFQELQERYPEDETGKSNNSQCLSEILEAHVPYLTNT
ncbi:6281_t:CDS:1 [Ambispora leptoticha]|uniref:6281_t:CDS:1 n=1 Tax=Ambispora leptoticha TaxID=144679 RepID=A0A9N8ZKC7_9GLOM|nr:6281_t:CDS:1 [Ambispora leptoticha]